MNKQEPTLPLKDGELVSFKASQANTGALTINRKVMMLVHEDGRPLLAGDLKIGQGFTVDLNTGVTVIDD